MLMGFPKQCSRGSLSHWTPDDAWRLANTTANRKAAGLEERPYTQSTDRMSFMAHGELSLPVK